MAGLWRWEFAATGLLENNTFMYISGCWQLRGKTVSLLMVMKEVQAVIYFSIYIKTGRSGSTQNYNNKIFFLFFPPDILKGCKQ